MRPVEVIRANNASKAHIVDIRSLKALVFERFPKDSAIYDVLLSEQDLLDRSEFSAKVDVWLKLLRRIKN